MIKVREISNRNVTIVYMNVKKVFDIRYRGLRGKTFYFGKNRRGEVKVKGRRPFLINFLSGDTYNTGDSEVLS